MFNLKKISKSGRFTFAIIIVALAVAFAAIPVSADGEVTEGTSQTSETGESTEDTSQTSETEESTEDTSQTSETGESTEDTSQTSETGESTEDTPPAEETLTFSDVQDSSAYYYKAVCWAAENGITMGYSDRTFRPQNNCERREMLIFLWRLSGKPFDAEYSNPHEVFNDMEAYDETTDTYKAVAWGISNGIVKGYSDGGFHPTASVTRKDTLIMLYRAAGKPDTVGNLIYEDVISEDYKSESDTCKAIVWARKTRITHGYSDGSFRPLDECLREHIVTFMYRYAHLGEVDTSQYVIVIDPGHDSYYSGAVSGDLNEEVLNLKIAQALKAELETYEGVKVLLTHDTLEPAVSTSLVDNLNYRTEFAQENMADYFISIHNDIVESQNDEIRGVMFIVQNESWKPTMAEIGNALAETIAAEYEDSGYNIRSIFSRDYCIDYSWETMYYYPDGSVGDYYNVLRKAKERDIPAMIIEHSVMNNPEDYELLCSDSELEKLGKCDAAGIAAYLGLEKTLE